MPFLTSYSWACSWSVCSLQRPGTGSYSCASGADQARYWPHKTGSFSWPALTDGGCTHRWWLPSRESSGDYSWQFPAEYFCNSDADQANCCLHGPRLSPYTACTGDEVVYKSPDTVPDQHAVMTYPTEVLNSLEPSRMPPRILLLKFGVPIMVLGNAIAQGALWRNLCATALKSQLLQALIMVKMFSCHGSLWYHQMKTYLLTSNSFVYSDLPCKLHAHINVSHLGVTRPASTLLCRGAVFHCTVPGHRRWAPKQRSPPKAGFSDSVL